MSDLVAARMGSAGTAHESDESSDPFAPLDELYRMEGIKKKLQQLKNTYDIALREGEETSPLGHFLFLGSPGTGKTTVARAAAGILFQLGLISRSNVVETSGLNLTGQFLGETKTKVEEQLDKAKGGVLFIDEAYELGKGQYGVEACSTLVAAMTDPRYANLVIIMAGYHAQMSRMLDTNPGLKSRFQHFLEFPDWAPSDCVDGFTKRAASCEYTMQPDAIASLDWGFEQLTRLRGWGNARDVEQVWRSALQSRADRVVGLPVSEEKLLTEGDLCAALEALIVARKLGSECVPPEEVSGQVEYESLSRQQLQALVKAAGVKANIKSAETITSLGDIAAKEAATEACPLAQTMTADPGGSSHLSPTQQQYMPAPEPYQEWEAEDALITGKETTCDYMEVANGIAQNEDNVYFRFAYNEINLGAPTVFTPFTDII